MHKFRVVLSASPLINDKAAVIAIAIPAIELIIALFLSFKALRLIGMIMSFLLMIIFSAYIGYLILTTSNLPCSCGGVIEAMSWKQHLVFNLALTIIAIVGLYISVKQRGFLNKEIAG